ncbi:molybdopterin converting factor subunit 1 [Candidatus Endoriftia persephone]|jgi:molybdopterin synthase sulfur carrier subunit|nr:molybdopterin converting factor subunit 1 [Candidatus Endoriftia persephone]USF87475.1 molybdopterin converting factor subunit 1 [Candidatus Endoriftia persephone]
MIQIRFFARLREMLEVESEQMELAGMATIADVVEQLQQRGGVWQQAFGGGNTVMMALNQEMASAESAVADGDEVAFFPPVTGG